MAPLPRNTWQPVCIAVGTEVWHSTLSTDRGDCLPRWLSISKAWGPSGDDVSPFVCPLMTYPFMHTSLSWHHPPSRRAESQPRSTSPPVAHHLTHWDLSFLPHGLCFFSALRQGLRVHQGHLTPSPPTQPHATQVHLLTLHLDP